MKNITKRFIPGYMTTVAMTLGLGLVTATANANILSISSWQGNTSAGYSADFSNLNVGSTFNDTIPFSIPSDASGNGTVSVIGLSDTSINFTEFMLQESSTGKTFSGATGGNTSSLNFSGGAAPGQYKLSIAGTGGGQSLSAYLGNIDIYPGVAVVSAIPEPETYAMMLAGLSLLGFSARRKTNNGLALGLPAS